MASEQRGFVFAVSFIVIFAALLATIPADLQGAESEAANIFPIDPSIVTDFADGENYTKSAFSGSPLLYQYSLGAKDWRCNYYSTVFVLASKVYFWFLWLGQTDSVNFLSNNGTDRGSTLSLIEIDLDDVDGVAKYTITNVVSGDSAGGFIVYWNTTAYPDPEDAWDNDVLYLIHGVGFTTTATNDVGALLVGLLFLQLPEVPVLLNILLVTPIWASIIYVLWYVIKEMIPFV